MHFGFLVKCLVIPFKTLMNKYFQIRYEQPDWIWDEQNELYSPTVDKLETLSVTTFSEWHQRSTEPEDIILTASFAQPALQQPGTMVVVALGIEVSSYQLDSTMANAIGVGTMKIVECYV